MTAPDQPGGPGYDALYEAFDSPMARQLREEAYGQDIGQHSWVTADELQGDIAHLRLSRSSHLLDVGCGPGGPLTFVVGLAGCSGTGVDVSAAAIAVGCARVASLGLEGLVRLRKVDLNGPVPFSNQTFDAVMALDVVLHLRNRLDLFREVARVLVPGGRFLFTDAGILAGAVSDEEMRRRTIHGDIRFVPAGFNERLLEAAGLRLERGEDRTASLLKNAAGRLAARLTHRAELEKRETAPEFERQQRYLETVIALSRRGAVSRRMYLAESRAHGS